MAGELELHDLYVSSNSKSSKILHILYKVQNNMHKKNIKL